MRIAHNAITAKLIDPPRDVQLEALRVLTYRVEGAENTSRFRMGEWDGTASFFDFDTNTFPAGFLRTVIAALKTIGTTCQIVAKPLPPALGPALPQVDEFGYHDRYDYQVEAMEKVIRHGNVILQVATGGGKSRIVRMVFKRIGRQTLFLTTRSVLLHQMKDAVEKMTGEPVAVLGDGEWGIPYKKADGSKGRKLSQFTVGMVQTLAQRLAGANPQDSDADREAHMRRREITLEVLAKFDVVFAEEAHEVSGTAFYDVMQACKSARYRVALTATPFMKTDAEANMRLLACTGNIAIKISEELLIERGILARPYFKYLRMPEEHKPTGFGSGLYWATPYIRAYEVGIVHHAYRNKLLCAEVMRGMRYGLNSLVLVIHKKHGEILLEMLTRAGVRAQFLFGEHSQKARKKALDALAKGEIDALIGSTIVDVGVDVPSIGMILLAGGGKAEVALRQRVGRGLREKKGGLPNCAFIVDVADDFNEHLKSHALQRRQIIEHTPGFSDNIVTDFDFAGLGFKRLPVAA